jgi:hypothetical protein
MSSVLVTSPWQPLSNNSPTVSGDFDLFRYGIEYISHRDVESALNAIAELVTNMDDRSPTDGAVELASEWLPKLFERASKLGGWDKPHISSTEAGEIVFEWWHDARKLTLYFSDDGAELIEVWGYDIENEMRSGSLSNIAFVNAWLQLRF